MIDSFRGDYRWLSNFHPCEIRYKGKIYSSTEHAYQATKVLDDIGHEKVRTAATPGLAMRLGRRLSDDPKWNDHKLTVMEDIIRYKFTIHSDLKQKLLNTGDQELIEGNDWGDVFWGVCGDSGENHLGKILMKIRSELQ